MTDSSKNVKFVSFDEMIIKIASNIRSGEYSTDGYLGIISKQLDCLSPEDKQHFMPHITRINLALATVKNMVDNRQNKTYSRIRWGWNLNKDEMNTLAFPFEWRIHERINKDIEQSRKYV